MKWWLTTCAVRCGDQQLRCTHCTCGLFQFGSVASPWNTTVIPAGGWRYLFLEAVAELRRKGYAMESDIEENELDKGDEQLFHDLELRHTERSCWCFQQKCTHQPCCSNTERHMNEARTSSDLSTPHHVTLQADELRSYCLLRHVTYVQAMLVFKWL